MEDSGRRQQGEAAEACILNPGSGALCQLSSGVAQCCSALLTQDWKDIDFALSEDVDFIAVSFVKTADVMVNLKSYVANRSDNPVEVIAKIESFDSVPNVQEIVEASDGVMVARGDLGAPPRLFRTCCFEVDFSRTCPRHTLVFVDEYRLLCAMLGGATSISADDALSVS